jgi:starch phosphorylase
VGAENFFLFGHDVSELAALRASGYRPDALCATDPLLAAVVDALRGGLFSPEEPGLFAPLVDSLLLEDRYFVLADFAPYVACQRRVDDTYRDVRTWTRMSVLNTARSGRFSSDRSIREYARDIWKVERTPIGLISQADIKGGVIQ